MPPISTRIEIDWSPKDDRDPAPVFRYRAPSGSQRERWRTRVLALAGDNPSDADMRRIVVGGVDDLWSEPTEREAILKLWDASQAVAVEIRKIAERVREARDADPEADITAFQDEAKAVALQQEQIEQLERLDDTLRANHPPYSRALERRYLWNAFAPRVAVQLFCTGWDHATTEDGDELPFRRTGSEISADLVDQLKASDVIQFGLTIIASMFPSSGDAKKAASPSGSAVDPTSSSKTESSSIDPTATAG